jgi:hypothetical protein
MMFQSPTGSRFAAAFWLLTVAWLCANIQPGTPATLLQWLAEGRSFSHQQRLMSDVAVLLGGEKEPVAVTESEPARPPAPRLPVVLEGMFKKLEVPLARDAPVVIPPTEEVALRAEDRAFASQERPPPPHGPPRSRHAG